MIGPNFFQFGGFPTSRQAFGGLDAAMGNPLADVIAAGFSESVTSGLGANRSLTRSLLPFFLSQPQGFDVTTQFLAMMLREALALPKEFDGLLSQLAKQVPAETVENLLAQAVADDTIQLPKEEKAQQILEMLAAPVDAETLAPTLKEGADKAQQQLMKMLQTGDPNMARYGPQISKLASMLGKMGTDLGANPTRAKAIQTLVALYLPWFPLAPGQQLQITEEGGGETEAGETERSLVIYVKTASLGRFRIAISEKEVLRAYITVWHEDVAKGFCPKLKQELTKYSQQMGLPLPQLMLETVDPEQAQTQLELLHDAPSEGDTATAQDIPNAGQGFKGATRQADTKKLHIQRGQAVSLMMVNMAYFIARTIFEADEQGRNLQQQKAKP